MGTQTRSMNMLKALMSHPLDGEQKPWKPYYGYMFLAMLGVSGVLYAYQRVNGGPALPISANPAALYDEAKVRNATTAAPLVVAPLDPVRPDALDDVAKAALAILAQTPMTLPDAETLSGDALEVAAMIEAHDVLVNAVVIEDPSVDEIMVYVEGAIPVYMPVILAGETSQHWVMLDATFQHTDLEAMAGNRVVIVQKK